MNWIGVGVGVVVQFCDDYEIQQLLFLRKCLLYEDISIKLNAYM